MPMSYSSHYSIERYKTARHEAIHILAAIRSRFVPTCVDLAEGGATTIQWPVFAHELPQLFLTNPKKATTLLRGVIATCIAPSLDEGQPVGANPGDAAVVEDWQQYWTGPPRWHDLRISVAHAVRAWLREVDNRLHIQELARTLYCEGRLAGEDLQTVIDQILNRPIPANLYQGATPPPTKPRANRTILPVQVTERRHRAQDQNAAPYSTGRSGLFQPYEPGFLA